MSYDPSIWPVVNSPIGYAQGTPDSARSMYYDSTNFLFRPFQSTAEANTYLPLSKFREGKYTLFLNTTGTLNPDGTLTGGLVQEYWYRDGVYDEDLILKETGGGDSSLLGDL